MRNEEISNFEFRILHSEFEILHSSSPRRERRPRRCTTIRRGISGSWCGSSRMWRRGSSSDECGMKNFEFRIQNSEFFIRNSKFFIHHPRGENAAPGDVRRSGGVFPGAGAVRQGCGEGGVQVMNAE